MPSWVPVDGASAMLLPLAAVIPAALVGGSLGGLVRLRRPVLGAFVAVWISWAIGIIVLPAAATLLGAPLQVGIVCIEGCDVAMYNGGLGYGFQAYGVMILLVAIGLAADEMQARLPLLLGEVLAIAAAYAGRRHALVAGVVLAVLAHGAVHALSLLQGGLAAWLCLAVGVIIWSVVLPRPAIRPAAAQAALADEPPPVTSPRRRLPASRHCPLPEERPSRGNEGIARHG